MDMQLSPETESLIAEVRAWNAAGDEEKRRRALNRLVHSEEGRRALVKLAKGEGPERHFEDGADLEPTGVE